MEIQTLTFDVHGMTDRQAYHYVESFRLGISEFDGLERHGRSRRSVQGEYVVFCAWKDEKAVTAFRHSELYAKLALNPHVINLRDHVEGVITGVVEGELAAAA